MKPESRWTTAYLAGGLLINIALKNTPITTFITSILQIISLLIVNHIQTKPKPNNTNTQSLRIATITLLLIAPIVTAGIIAIL